MDLSGTKTQPKTNVVNQTAVIKELFYYFTLFVQIINTLLFLKDRVIRYGT